MKPATNWAAMPQIHVAGVLLVFTALAIGIWLPSGFVPLSSPGIGEMFEAYHGALNVERFGWAWGGLQDMATNPDPSAHPVLYIHHPNLGLYVSHAMRRLGIVAVEAQNFASLLATLCGLAVAYVFAWRISGSTVLAMLMLVLLAFDLNFLGNWAFNIHRAFSYLAFFGVIVAFEKAAETDRRRGRWLIAAVVACLLILGADYMFYFFTLFVLMGSYLTRSQSWRWRATWVFILLAIYGIGFCLRQLQVMAGIGPDVWVYDFVYQVLNRLGIEALAQGAASEAAAEFYRTQAVLNPGFSVVPTFFVRGYQFAVYAGEVFLRDVVGIFEPHKRLSLAAGILLLVFAGGMTAIAHIPRLYPFARPVSIATLAVALAAMLGNTAYLLHGSLWLAIGVFGVGIAVIAGLSARWLGDVDPVQLRPLARWGGIFLVACGAMILVFPTYFSNWYRAFLLGPACTAVWLTILLAPLFGRWARARRPLFVTAGAVKAVSLIVALAVQPAPVQDHAEALRTLRGVPTASNFTPASIASYTQAFSGFLTPAGAQRLLMTGEVRPEDYAMMFERDRENPLYRRPQYFIYLKQVSIFAGDWSFLDRLDQKPVAEGAAYAIYLVPPAVSDSDIAPAMKERK